MMGPKIVAALKAIINTTSLMQLSTEDKTEVKHLLDLIQFCIANGGVLGVTVDDDVDLSKYSMSLSNSGYVHFRKVGECTLLHRLLMELEAGDQMTVDHIDGDKL